MIPHYRLTDVIFSSLSDDVDRHDVTTSGTIILPRPEVNVTARQRFSKRVATISRPDFTDRPTSFLAATTGVPDRPRTSSPTTTTKKKLILTLKHYLRPKPRVIR